MADPQLLKEDQVTLDAIILAGGNKNINIRATPNQFSLYRSTKEQRQWLNDLVPLKPDVVEEFVEYLLSGKHAPFELKENEPWKTEDWDISMSIDLLQKLDKDPNEIADRVLATLDSSRGNSGIVDNYIRAWGVGYGNFKAHYDRRLSTKGKYRAVHDSIWERLPNVITPEVIIGAIDELRSEGETSKNNPLSDSYAYRMLAGTYAGVQSGETEKYLVDVYLNERTLSGKSLKNQQEYIDQEIGGYKENNHSQRRVDEINQGIIEPMFAILKDFREELGEGPYKQLGYRNAQGEVQKLQFQVLNIQKKIYDGIDAIGEKLKLEREQLQPSKGGFLSKVLSK